MRKLPRTLAPELTDDELSSLLSILRENKFPGNHLEIGTAAGGTLSHMMKVFSEDVRPNFIVVDPMKYFENQVDIVKKNLQNSGISPDTVHFRIMTSTEAFKESSQRGESFDFIFIDGAHKIHYVTHDLKWTRLLRNRGIVCLHDYTTVRGVTLAVDRFLRKNPHYEIVKLVDTLLILRKTKELNRHEVSFTDRLWASALAPLLRLEVFSKKVLQGTS